MSYMFLTFSTFSDEPDSTWGCSSFWERTLKASQQTGLGLENIRSDLRPSTASALLGLVPVAKKHDHESQNMVGGGIDMKNIAFSIIFCHKPGNT